MFSTEALRHAPWSVSKVKAALTCPLSFRYRYIDHLPEEDAALATRVGSATHAVLDLVLGGAAIEAALEAVTAKLALRPEELEGTRRFLPGIEAFRATRDRFREASPVARELREDRLAITADLRPVAFGSGEAFFRGVLDVGFVLADGRVVVIDHKTAKNRGLRWFEDQLRAYAVMALAHFAGLTRVWPAIHFVGEAEVVWGAPLAPDAIRGATQAWFGRWIERAAAKACATEHPAIVTGLCNFCGYRRRCPAHRIDSDAATERLVSLANGRLFR